MIEGQTVRLRSWREDDLQKLTDLRNNIAIQSQLLSRVRGSNCEQTRQWLQKRSSSPDSLILVVVDKSLDIPAGYIQFIEIDSIDQRAKLGICLNYEFQGKGIGSEVLLLAFKYLYDSFAIRKVILEVRADNERAVKCYEKIGFKTCGIFHGHTYIDGRWRDLVLMELFLSTLFDKS